MDWDLIIVIVGTVLIFVGLIGCIIPLLPGPFIAWIALPLLLLTSDGYAEFDQTWFIVLTLLMIAVTVVDLLLPIWGSKLTGGTTSGKIGSAIGLVIGLIFLGPLGLFFGPFLGALFGELSTGKDLQFALKSGIGSLIGLLLGTVFKVGVVVVIAFQFVVWLS
jgi:hypothetical protein